jgi:serine/threonine protein kinase
MWAVLAKRLTESLQAVDGEVEIMQAKSAYRRDGDGESPEAVAALLDSVLLRAGACVCVCVVSLSLSLSLSCVCVFVCLKISASMSPSLPLTTSTTPDRYRAPEVLLTDGRYDCAQDVWAAGCTFAEFAARKPLFPGNCRCVCVDV